jgi:hypothetical protein
MIAWNTFNGAECVMLYDFKAPFEYTSQFFAGSFDDYRANLTKGANPPPDVDPGTVRPEVAQALATAQAGYQAWVDANIAKNKAKHGKGKHNPSGG